MLAGKYSIGMPDADWCTLHTIQGILHNGDGQVSNNRHARVVVELIPPRVFTFNNTTAHPELSQTVQCVPAGNPLLSSIVCNVLAPAWQQTLAS